MSWRTRLEAAIPGGAHTYSRGGDQYASLAPEILVRGKGAYVWDPEGNKFLDYGMGLRSVILGYADKSVNKAVVREIKHGNSLSRPSTTELYAAERLIELIPSAEMVKFAKNGSNVTSAASKMARAYTNRKYICVPNQQPFFSFDDWFIGSTAVKRGIPENYHELTLKFDFGSIDTLESLFDKYPGEIAAVMLEPATHLLPCLDKCKKVSGNLECLSCPNVKENFLRQVQALCKRHGAVFILDEMRTGFRWHLRGAQEMYGVSPDLTTFGKALANGFSVAALVGKKEIMDLASINKVGTERVFLLSSTNGAEMSSLGALLETTRRLENEKVSEYLWDYGKRLSDGFTRLAKDIKVDKYIFVEGPSVALELVALDANLQPSAKFRTLFLQEMAKNRVLVASGNTFAPSFAHGERELKATLNAFSNSLLVYKNAIERDVKIYLEGEEVKPVFRKYN
jgi:glutamate-1-semialdehyde 2,1-aminomutase